MNQYQFPGPKYHREAERVSDGPGCANAFVHAWIALCVIVSAIGWAKHFGWL